MNANKFLNANSRSTYLNQIRRRTAYPTYRNIIGLIVGLVRIFGIIAIGIFLYSIFIAMTAEEFDDEFIAGGIISLFLGGFLLVMASFGKEVLIMFVDLVDSTIEANSRGTDDDPISALIKS